MSQSTAIAVTLTPAQAVGVARPLVMGLLLLLTVTLILLFGAAWTPAT